MKQLKMIRKKGTVTKRELPVGYSFVLFENWESDVDAWSNICRAASMVKTDNNREAFDKIIMTVKGIEPEKDLFFVVDPNGRKVATSTLIHNKEKNTGYLHMVAAIPDVRNLGIGHAMLSHAMKMAEQRSIDSCSLTTDDYRLPAIKNYLCGGFVPVLYGGEHKEMRERWSEVAKKLGIEISEKDFIIEE